MSNISNNIFLTTAIAYTNGPPHIGHLYELVLSDFINKTLINNGYNTKLMSGTDEHGQKIEKTAKSLGINPIELCNINSNLFKELSKSLEVSLDYFIRTTDEFHKNIVKELFSKCIENNYIYLSEYSGFYNIREERFITNSEYLETNGKDPISGNDYLEMKEESYFFKMSEFKNFITLLINDTLYNQELRNDIKNRIENLEDLSVTRTSFKWGIPITENDNHVIYVWFDALLNYYTGLLQQEEQFVNNSETVNIIGKDILWFHAVIYPSILKSLNLEKFIPKKILVHGFITDANGQKMSKSLGNVVSCEELLKEFPIDAIRFYLIWESEWNKDIKFCKNRLKDIYNNILIKNYGNLCQRIYSLMYKELQISDILKEYIINTYNLRKKSEQNIQNTQNTQNTQNILDLTEYKKNIEEKLKFINVYISEKKPWADVDNDIKYEKICYAFLEMLDISIKLYPIIPNKIMEILNLFGISNNCNEINLEFLELRQQKIKIFNIL
jgi:methionyl-tRNA synthetase